MLQFLGSANKSVAVGGVSNRRFTVVPARTRKLKGSVYVYVGAGTAAGPGEQGSRQEWVHNRAPGIFVYFWLCRAMFAATRFSKAPRTANILPGVVFSASGVDTPVSLVSRQLLAALRNDLINIGVHIVFTFA